MKKGMILFIAALGVAGVAHAADVSAGVDFSSAYVFRGVTLNNGFVMQPSAEISGFPIDEKYGSLAASIWGNYDIDDEDGAGSDFSEIDYYVAYSLPVEVVDIGLSYTEYTYPNGGTADKEVGLSLGKALGTNGFSTALSFNYGVGGVIDESLYIQGSLDYETDLTEKLSATASATIAYLVNDAGPDGLNDATLSAGLSYALNENWSLSGGVTTIAQLDSDVLADATATSVGYDVDLLGTIGLSCIF